MSSKGRHAVIEPAPDLVPGVSGDNVWLVTGAKVWTVFLAATSSLAHLRRDRRLSTRVAAGIPPRCSGAVDAPSV